MEASQVVIIRNLSYDDSNWFMECKNDVATREVKEHQVRNEKTKD